MNFRSPRVVGFLTLLVIALGACTAPVKVSTDYSKADFSALKSYRWLPTEESTRNPDIPNAVHDQIRASIDDNLRAKDYNLTNAPTADFQLAYSVTSTWKYDISTYRIYDSYYRPYDGYSAGLSWKDNYGYQRGSEWVDTDAKRVTESREGTLIVDILDQDNNVIWRGVGTKQLNEITSQGDADKLVKEAVNAILKNFPPPA